MLEFSSKNLEQSVRAATCRAAEYTSIKERHEVLFSTTHLKFLNQQLQKLSPEGILRWSLITLPNLYQTTAFGLSGLVILDMISKLLREADSPVDLIFVDTLHHFKQTLSLVDRVRARYPNVRLHVYKPKGVDTAEQFAAQYGSELWDSNEELYDWLAKVEPSRRAYAELEVKAVLTGRRRTQGDARDGLGVVEIDDSGLIKVNPLVNWPFAQVKQYIDEHDVPYNELLDLGYKSVGDWHSTQPVKNGEDERAGRWKGKPKSECGLHNPASRYAVFLNEKESGSGILQTFQSGLKAY